MTGREVNAGSASAQLAPALLERAVLLQAMHDAIQRCGVDAELGAGFADGDARPRFDHLEQLVAAPVLPPAPHAAVGRRAGTSRAAAGAPAGARWGVSRRGRGDAESL